MSHFLQTCPNCGSDRIVTDARVMLNTMEFVQFAREDTYDSCLDCGAEDIPELVETFVPDEPTEPSLVEILTTMSAYLLEIHEVDNDMFASRHDGDAEEPGPNVEGCTYCRVIYQAKVAIHGEDVADEWVRERKGEYDGVQ